MSIKQAEATSQATCTATLKGHDFEQMLSCVKVMQNDQRNCTLHWNRHSTQQNCKHYKV